MTVTPEALSALSLTAGDKVLLLFGRGDVKPDEAVSIQAQLAERFPGVSFTILSGAQQALVQHAEEESP